ncbi:hypothetical protein LINPERHAP1_LOCUS9314, partial [Linum perenne]
ESPDQPDHLESPYQPDQPECPDRPDHPRAPVPVPVRPKTPRSVPELPGPILCTLVIIFKISKGLPGTDSRTNPCQEEGNDGIRDTRPDPTDADPAPTLIPGRDYTRPRPTPAPPPEPWRDKAPDSDPEPNLGP